MSPQEIVDALRALPFAERANVANDAGLQIACCPGCGCYVGAPYCHDADQAVEWQAYGECPHPEQEGDDGAD